MHPDDDEDGYVNDGGLSEYEQKQIADRHPFPILESDKSKVLTEPALANPKLNQRKIGFVEQYLLPREHITLKGINESFRTADTKRLIFKSGLTAAGCAMTATGGYLAFHKDENGETHKVEGAFVGGAGVLTALFGLVMRPKPLQL